MKQKQLVSGTDLQSNTYYRFVGTEYHIYEQDTVLPEHSRKYTGLYGQDIPLSTAFYAVDAENITLDFGGATLVLHGKIQPFLFDRCRNVTVKNAVIRYDRSFFTEAELLEMSEDHMTLRIDKGQYPYEVVDGKLNLYSDTWKNDKLDSYPFFIQFFDKESREGFGAVVGEIGRTIT